MINTLEIPQERWTMFLRLFDRLMTGRYVRVEVMGVPLGDQELGDRIPFRGVDFDTKGSERGTITVTVGSDESGELTHRIVGPTRIYLGQDDGDIRWLAFEEKGEDGDKKTLIHFETVPELQAELPA